MMTEQQGDLFKPLLRDIVSPRHAMVKLSDAIDWQSFEDAYREAFVQMTVVPPVQFV